ncbi:hypothetical protein CKAN_02243500 [Cinnamomum micranthum f. kanehirae]|uniref:DUF7722 domain-containing protein n=1 Tax=Cinnamomum micranthum f. kanehirae TaxID=337451 RepID=A0A3S3QZR3_9MAGN|nr:hypothetical protein CKAN_02243500 [Cinnamomum micranthum f. kanehirae]
MGSLGSNVAQTMVNLGRKVDEQHVKKSCWEFQMPLHYPRYNKADYETMPEWKLDCLLKEYGLPLMGNTMEKRQFAMGAFLWPSQQRE